ncbi:unnamed protein product [Prorocentrum cordatum]|uniref:Reverse transcriptase domain-containing protein n=1 Tax=Prorocentrum cordatum TaxID=2364126 RepID=A0ABN9WEC1_9DINO|nr:unnamed protein product [Polarella glacialis]
MWLFQPSDRLDVHKYRSELSEYIRAQAKQVFGPPEKKPRQAWISQCTFEFVSLSGGFAMAVQHSKVAEMVVALEEVPFQDKGGRMVKLYKGKGDPRDLDCSRGLTVVDHQAKSFISLLKNDLEDAYHAFVPQSQHGAVAKKGTDLAHHFILTALAYAKAVGQCAFVLFVDLVKAFDGVVRELCMGFPQDVPETRSAQLEYLMGMGVDAPDAEWILDYIEQHGHAFQQIGVPEKLTRLVVALHTKSWFQADGADSFAYTRTGGRQGCKLGGLMFNCCYTLALNQLVQALREAGITTRSGR